MARGSFSFSGRESHDVKVFLRNSAGEPSSWKPAAEVEKERKGGKVCLHSPPAEIMNQPAGKKIRLWGECSFIRQFFQDPFYPIIGFAACQENFGQIKIILILPKGFFGG